MTTTLNTTLSLTQSPSQHVHVGKEPLSASGAQEYKLAVDRPNLTHRRIFFGSLGVSEIVELVVNIEKKKFPVEKSSFLAFLEKESGRCCRTSSTFLRDSN